MARSFLESYAYVVMEDKQLPEYLAFSYFLKSLTLLTYYCVENLDIRSAQGFLTWAYQRIVRISIYNLKGIEFKHATR